MEWFTVCALDVWYGALDLKVHPHCIPRQMDLSRRSRAGYGDSDRCAIQCVDAVVALTSLSITVSKFTAKTILHVAVLVVDAPSYVGHVAATHLIGAYLGTRRYLAKLGWLMYLLGDVAWLECELMVTAWLKFDFLGGICLLLATVAHSVMSCNIGGRLWRGIRRLLHHIRIHWHDRSLDSCLLVTGAPPHCFGLLPSPPVSTVPVYHSVTQSLDSPTHLNAAASLRGPLNPGGSVGKCFIAKRRNLAPSEAQGRAYDRVRAKAAISASKRKEPSWRSVTGAIWLSIIVDSGCTWHSHPDILDLVNVRACHERIACADGVEHACTAIGDLPLISLDEKGREHTVLLRDVRCVPSFTDTLISIEQLWSSSSIDVVFRNRKCLVQTKWTPTTRR